MLAGAGIAGDGDATSADIDWSETVAGPWLAQTLAALRGPDGLARVDPGPSLQGALRPYQQAGLQWLHLFTRLRLGACLADDMGLGKTIQVLSLLLVLKDGADAERKPSLLVAPASLLANWTAEIARFAPSLRAVTAHPSAPRPDLCPQRLRGRSADRQGRGSGVRQRLRALQDQDRHCAGGGAPLEVDLPGLLGNHRFAGRAPARPFGERRHGPGVPGG